MKLTKDKFLTEREVLSLRQSLSNDRDSLLIKFMLETGARVSEALSISAKDLDHDRKAVQILGLKGSDSRLIPLSADLYNGIIGLLIVGKPIFDVSPQWINRVLKSRFKLNKSCHSLRHTFAITLYKTTKDIHLVKSALGHRSIANTMIYLEFVHEQEELQQLVDMYSRLGTLKVHA